MLLFSLSRRVILMMLASYPNNQDITICFDESMKMESMLVEPSNVTYWLHNDEEKKDSCLTFAGSLDIIQGRDI